MIYKRFDKKIVIRLRKGDKLVESIREVLEKENVKAGSLTGLGAVNYLDLGIFNIKEKSYDKMIIKEDMELTSLVGNISQKDGQVYTHLHIVCGKMDASTLSGHLNEAIISLTAEIFIDIIDGEIFRKEDSELGINLIEL